jgi:hypothetical protein
MPTKLSSKCIQLHPEIWKLLQNEAEQRDMSTSGFIRECIEDYLQRNIVKDIIDIPGNLSKEDIKRLSKKNLLEIAKYMNQAYDKEQKSAE